MIKTPASKAPTGAAAMLNTAWDDMLAGRRARALGLVRAAAPAAGSPRAHSLAGAILNGLGLAADALPHIEAAARGAPDEPGFQHDLALVLKSLGRAEEAAEVCERAIALRPDLARAHLILSSLRRWSADDNHVARLEALRRDMPDSMDRVRVGYALFKELDDLDRRDQAWTALTQAAGEAREGLPWPALMDDQLPALLRANFPRSLIDQPTMAEAGRPAPIFIVGLPRSGSTLVEQILAAHSDTVALGELTTLGLLMNKAAGVGDAQFYPAPRALVNAKVIDWGQVGRAYRIEARPFAPKGLVVIDKLPQNWALAGAMALAFPDARIVHVRRDPMDALFGAYRMLFGGEHRWSYAQEDLARHHHNYSAGMAHWRQVLGPRLIEVEYESLVRAPEMGVARLLAACRLASEPACFAPHEAAGGVATPSSLQVREPISDRNIGAWRRYEAELAPLREALENQA